MSSFTPSETDTLLQPETFTTEIDQAEYDRPVQIDAFRKNVKRCKVALGLCLPAVLMLEGRHLTMALSEPLGREGSGSTRRASLEGQMWTDVVGSIGAIIMIILYIASLIYPITIRTFSLVPEIRHEHLHRTLCITLFMGLLALILIHPLPGIIYTVITHLAPPALSAKNSTLVRHLRTAALFTTLIVVGCMRRGPKLYFPPPRIGTGFGVTEEKDEEQLDSRVVIKLTPAQEESDPLASAITIENQEGSLPTPEEGQPNVFDYANSSMLNFVFLSYIAPVAQRSAKVPALKQADLPLLERSTRDSGYKERVFMAENKDKKMVQVDKVTNWQLIRTMWGDKGMAVLISFLLETSRNVISFLQIAALHEIIQTFGQPPGSDKSYAYLMCVGMFLSHAVDALLAAYCGVRENYLLHIPIKMTIASVVLSKILRTADAKALEAHNVDEDDKENQGKGRSQVMNLMTIDSGTVASMATHTWGFANGIVTLLIGFTLLYSMLGVSAFVGIACIPLSTPLSYLVAKMIYRCDKEWARARDARTGALKELLLGIKVIKLNALEPYFMHRINRLRAHEVKWQRWRFTLGTAFNILADQLPILAILITFAFHTKVRGQPLDASTAFVALNVFNRVKDGLQAFPQIIQTILSCKVALNRICRFLSQPEIDADRYASASRRIICSNATIGWPAAEHKKAGGEVPSFKLEDVTLKVPERKLTLLCGPLGSGKTLLLRAFLGEASIESGAVVAPRSAPDATPVLTDAVHSKWTTDTWLNDSVAYAPQQSFIRHGTIRDNVLFGQPMWRERYREALRQAALLPDLDIFNEGDLTEVGEHGVTLSGGQKARVNLARCLYSRARTVYLDDILSAVDAHTAQFLYTECLRGSLLQDRTVVLVSHHIGLVLAGAGYVIVLSKGGRVERACPAEQASLDNLTTSVPKPTSPIQEEVQSPKVSKVQAPTFQERDESSVVSRHIYREEHKAIGRVSRNHYLLIFRSAGGSWYWTILILFHVGQRVLGMGRTFWLARWSADPSPAHLDFYLSIYVVVVTVGIVIGGLRWVILYGFGDFGFYSRGSKVIHDIVLRRVFGAPLQFFETTPQGRLLNVFGQDIFRLDSNSADDFGRTLMNGLAMATAAGVVFVKEPIVALVAVAFGIPLFWISGHLNKLRSDIRRLTATASSPLYSLYNETIDGVVMIRAFGQSKLTMAAMRVINNRERTTWLSDWAVYNWVRAIIRSITSVVVAVTGFVLVGRDISPSEAGLILSFALTVSNGLFDLMERYSSLEQTFVSAERVNHYITMPDHESEDGIIPEKQWPSRGEIKVENLSVRYAPDLPEVLKGVSFTIEPGSRVGLVGATGSGKSTLALSLFRAINHMEGSLHIDGIDINTVALPELRGRLNMVAQDGMLCSGTLREALDVAGNRDDHEIYEALRRVHLLSDNVTAEELETNPFASLETYVAIEGGNFSQGQRQLLCLARALLKNSKILVMDEATSSVDFEMDSKITATIKECFAGTTMLVIAHRLATIMQYDKVLVLERGRIVETGVPKELMEDRKSLFHALCMAQGEEEFSSLLALARS